MLFQGLHMNKVEPPYGHLGNTVTSLLRQLFSGPAKKPYIFLLKNPVNAVTC